MQMYKYDSVDWSYLVNGVSKLYDKHENDWKTSGRDCMTNFIDNDLTPCFGGNGIPVACFTQTREQIRLCGKYEQDREDFISYNIVAVRLVVALGLITTVKKILGNNYTLSYGTFKDDGTLVEMKYNTSKGVKTIFIDDLPIALFGLDIKQIEELYLTNNSGVILDKNKSFNSSHVMNQVISYNIHLGPQVLRRGLDPWEDYTNFQAICTDLSKLSKAAKATVGDLLTIVVD